MIPVEKGSKDKKSNELVSESEREKKFSPRFYNNVHINYPHRGITNTFPSPDTITLKPRTTRPH